MATDVSLLVHFTFLLVAFSGATAAERTSLAPTSRVRSGLFRDTPLTGMAAAVTVTWQAAVLPPSTVVTVMVVVPGAMAVTFPAPSTVAIFGSPVVQVTALLGAVSGATAAARVSLAPTARERVVLFRVTPVTALVTVTWQAAVLPPSSVVAVMVAVPGAMAVTFPVASTVAIFSSLVLHFTVLLVAFSGATVAVSVSLAPAARANSVLFRVTPVTGIWDTAPTDSVPFW